MSLIVLRFAGYIVLIAIAAAIVLFLVTRDKRYIRLAWQLLKFSTVFLLVFAALLVIGRVILL